MSDYQILPEHNFYSSVPKSNFSHWPNSKSLSSTIVYVVACCIEYLKCQEVSVLTHSIQILKWQSAVPEGYKPVPEGYKPVPEGYKRFLKVINRFLKVINTQVTYRAARAAKNR